MTGRRPKRSDTTPRTGEKKNCIAANTVPKMPFQSAAMFMLPPRKSRISLGSTGAINPSASMSSMTVTKIKTTAARRVLIFPFLCRQLVYRNYCGAASARASIWAIDGLALSIQLLVAASSSSSTGVARGTVLSLRATAPAKLRGRFQCLPNLYSA